MATSTANTPDAYVASLPRDRGAAIAMVRATLNARIQPGFEEGMQYGMISWYVPVSRLASTYNGQPFALACLASQKNYMALYLMSAYTDSFTGKRFVDEYKKSGKKLDMGKACIRFKTADDLALEVIGEAVSAISVDNWIAVHEATHSKAATTKRRQSRAATKAKPARPAKAKPARPAKAKPARPAKAKSAKPTKKRGR